MDIFPSSRAHPFSDGGYRLRERAVLYEDAKARDPKDVYLRPNGKPQLHSILPLPELVEGLPLLAQYIARFGMLPSVTRSASKLRPKFLRVHAMHSFGGELVFVRLALSELDDWPLRAVPTVARARQLLTSYLKTHAPDPAAYEVALQRGRHGSTHLHILLPLASLANPLRRKAKLAQAGEGGGISPSSKLHVVRVEDTPGDREAVTAYMNREPDGRLNPNNSSDPAYFRALEELLEHRASGQLTQLTWGKLPRAWRS